MNPTQEKLDAILNKCNSLETKLEVSITYQKIQEKRIEKQEKQIEVLEASRNQAIGKQTVVSFVTGLIGAGVMALIKTFTS